MKKIVKLSIATAMLMGMGAVSAQAADGISILDGVYVKGELRPRYEMVDADNTSGNANAMTNRLVIGAGSDALFGSDKLGAYLEMTNISSLNDDNYNSTDNGNPNNKQVVADPEQTRVTQSYIDIKPMDGLLIRYGRQMINLGDQRFVGAVGWRQMPQTYDATLLSYSPTKEINFSTVYATQVNSVKVSSFDTKTSLTNLSYRTKGLDITAYAYLIGAGSSAATGVGAGSDTFGAYAKGKLGSDGMKVSYRAEYAIQKDASIDNSGYVDTGDNDLDSSYIHVDLGLNMSGILVGAAYMMQTANDDTTTGHAFTTPLGTNHKYGGWADQFLTTPVDGLQDISVMAGYKAKGFGTFKVIYHEFTSDEGSIDYGTEIDAMYANKIPGVKGLKGLLKFADYSADDSAASGNPKAIDTQKVWLMASYKFTSK